jgi:hypothetical protein
MNDSSPSAEMTKIISQITGVRKETGQLHNINNNMEQKGIQYNCTQLVQHFLRDLLASFDALLSPVHD